MSLWRTIDSAPKDGTPLRLRRIYEGAVIADGPGLWGFLHEDAPSRRGLGADPLNRLKPEDYEREARHREAWVSAPKWLTENRLFAFPTPTHWMPLPEAPK